MVLVHLEAHEYRKRLVALGVVLLTGGLAAVFWYFILTMSNIINLILSGGVEASKDVVLAGVVCGICMQFCDIVGFYTNFVRQWFMNIFVSVFKVYQIVWTFFNSYQNVTIWDSVMYVQVNGVLCGLIIIGVETTKDYISQRKEARRI